MPINKVVNFGCSFAHGYGGVPLDKGYESIGYKLAQSHNLQYVDQARNGNNNEGIVRNIRNFFSKNDSKDCAVVIGWTHSLRREYVGWNLKNSSPEMIDYREIPYEKSIFFKKAMKLLGGKRNNVMVEFNERPNRPLAYIEHIEYRKASCVIQAQEYLKNRHIPYVMYHACGNTQDVKLKDTRHIHSQIDKNYFYDFTGPSMDVWVIDNPGHTIADNHPNAKGHSAWFDKIAPMFAKAIT